MGEIYNMTREVLNVKMTGEFKAKVFNEIEKTINYALKKNDVELQEKERKKIKNLTLDQVNVHISQKMKSKSMWVFDAEKYIPVTVEVEKTLAPVKLHAKENSEDKLFRMENNLSWSYSRKNKNHEDSMNYEEFERKVLDILIEDFNTASFYGTLSYVVESSDIYERK